MHVTCFLTDFHKLKVLQIISREPDHVKSSLLEMNREVNKFQANYEGRKMSVFQDPEFKRQWAHIAELESKQPNGRRMFMTLYCHPVIGHLRVAKWLPKRNICGSDSEFLVMLSDDLRYGNDLFVIEGGPFEGHYQKVTDADTISGDATKISISGNDDSGFCPNCSQNATNPTKVNESDPDFVEIEDFSDSDTEYQTLAAKNRPQTSSKGPSAPDRPSLEESNINEDSLERRKFFKYGLSVKIPNQFSSGQQCLARQTTTVATTCATRPTAPH